MTCPCHGIDVSLCIKHLYTKPLEKGAIKNGQLKTKNWQDNGYKMTEKTRHTKTICVFMRKSCQCQSIIPVFILRWITAVTKSILIYIILSIVSNIDTVITQIPYIITIHISLARIWYQWTVVNSIWSPWNNDKTCNNYNLIR